MQQNRGRKERTGCRYGKLMRTLILNGSPRPQGDTAHLIQALRRELPGEVEQVDATGPRWRLVWIAGDVSTSRAVSSGTIWMPSTSWWMALT